MQTSVSALDLDKIGPEREARRIAALRSLEVLDSEPEERFDRITRMASTLLGVPIALVSLVDESRQWFKSRVGLPATQTPRAVAFCDHAIRAERVLVIPDAREDPRFASNPLVQDAPSIRFYAGAPLIFAPGVHLGTLCIIDRQPRLLSEQEIQLLRDLAAIVVDELSLRKHVADLRRAQEEREMLHRSIHHDLKAPVRQMLAYSRMLTEEHTDELSPEGREIAGRITRVASRAVSMTEELGQLASIEESEITKSPLELAPLVRSVLEDMSIQWPQAVFELDDRLDGSLVKAHATLLRQAVTNLIDNAAKHAGRPPRVIVEMAAIADGVRLSVLDNGTGVAKELRSRVFEPFFQCRADREGVGLGLAIVQSTVNAHGGRVWIDDAHLGGAAVHVELP